MIDYLLFELKNELATKTLVNKTEVAIKKRLESPYANLMAPTKALKSLLDFLSY